tara:strand:+ start:166042 stop:167043 length:1002 start_codon:yes stop_codon:yes gene_type:complete
MAMNNMRKLKNILFVVTPETSSKIAFQRAMTLAENNQAHLTVIKVIDGMVGSIRLPIRQTSLLTLQEKLIVVSKQELEVLARSCNKKIKVDTKVLIGTTFIEIIREVLRGEYDWVIKVAEIDDERLGRNFRSDDMNLLRKCPCPVLLINSKQGSLFKRILAAVDVDDNYEPKELNTRHRLNVNILETASSIALSESSADLQIIHAWRAVGESFMEGGFVSSSDEDVAEYVEEVRQQHVKNMDSLVDEVRTKLGAEAIEYIKPTIHLLKGWPRTVIPDFVNHAKADLVVMGTVGRTGVPGFIMGNTAETILNHINCSVLAIKPEGFKTPVTLND